MTSCMHPTASVQGRWRIREWTNLSAVPEFLCVLDGLGTAEIGDIAVMCEGDLVVSGRLCNSVRVTVSQRPSTSVSDSTSDVYTHVLSLDHRVIPPDLSQTSCSFAGMLQLLSCTKSN